MTHWTPRMEASLKRLRAEGHTFGECSRRLRVSRYACIGKAARLGLARPAPSKPTGPARPKLQPWNDPDPNDPDHEIDARDLQILDEMDKGRTPSAVARKFRTTEAYVRELWRVRELQDPVGER